MKTFRIPLSSRCREPQLLFGVSLLLLLVLAVSPAHSQAPPWRTAVVPSPASGFSNVYATAADASGNVYVAGTFNGTLSFGPTSVTSVGDDDLFVAKWSSSTSSFTWAQRAGGPAGDLAFAVAVSGPNVYVAGIFESPTISFGPISLSLTPASTPRNGDVFVAKLTDAGPTSSFTWAQGAGGPDDELAFGLAVQGPNVYVAGSFHSASASFGALTLTNPYPTVGGDVFVAKLTDAGSTGSFTWAQRAGGPGSDVGTDVAVSGQNVYVAGYIGEGAAAFGSTTLMGVGAADVFVTKLTDAGSTGSFTWVQGAGGAGRDGASAVAVNGANVYVTGFFQSPTARFGSISLSNGSTPDREDVFVTKLTDAGSTASFTWVQGAGGPGSEIANALAVSGQNVYVAGYFSEGAPTFGSTTLTSAGSADVFVTRLLDAGSTGSFSWAQRAGGGEGDEGNALAVSGSNVYVAGSLGGGAVVFGSTTLSLPPNSSRGFLAALSDALPLAAAGADPGADALSLYPNPAQGSTHVRLLPSPSPTTLTLLDAVGRVVLTRTVAPSRKDRAYMLDLRGLAPGLYTVQVQAGGLYAVRRLAIE